MVRARGAGRRPGFGVTESKGTDPQAPGMNAVTSPTAVHRPARLAIGRSREFGSLRRRGRELRQVGTFAAIGLVSTLAYVALYSFLRPFMDAAAANVVALVATAIGNTAANRRFTFAVRGRAGMARDHVAGLVALGAALVLTSASIAAMGFVAPSAPHAIEVVILVAANAAATLVRFLVLRIALDRSRPRGSRTAQPGHITPDQLLERTVR
jgi:putative flippase GtrA